METKNKFQYEGLEFARKDETPYDTTRRRKDERQFMRDNQIQIILQSAPNNTKIVFGWLDLYDEGRKIEIRRMDDDIIDTALFGIDGYDLKKTMMFAQFENIMNRPEYLRVKYDLMEAVRTATLLSKDQKSALLNSLSSAHIVEEYA